MSEPGQIEAHAKIDVNVDDSDVINAVNEIRDAGAAAADMLNHPGNPLVDAINTALPDLVGPLPNGGAPGAPPYPGIAPDMLFPQPGVQPGDPQALAQDSAWDNIREREKNIMLLRQTLKGNASALQKISEHDDLAPHLGDLEGGIREQRRGIREQLALANVPNETINALYGDEPQKEDRVAQKHADALIGSLSRMGGAMGGEGLGAVMAAAGGIAGGLGIGAAAALVLPALYHRIGETRELGKSLKETDVSAIAREPGLEQDIIDQQLAYANDPSMNLGTNLARRAAAQFSGAQSMGISMLDAENAENMRELLIARQVDPSIAADFAFQRGMPNSAQNGPTELAAAIAAGQGLDLNTWFPVQGRMDAMRQNTLRRDLTGVEEQDLLLSHAGMIAAAPAGQQHWIAAHGAEVEGGFESAARGASGAANAFLARVYASLPGEKSYEGFLTWKDSIGPAQVKQISDFAKQELGPAWKVFLRENGLISSMQDIPYYGAMADELTATNDKGETMSIGHYGEMNAAYQEAQANLSRTIAGRAQLRTAASETMQTLGGGALADLGYTASSAWNALMGNGKTGVELVNGTGGWVFKVEVQNRNEAAMLNNPTQPGGQ